ncbi:protein kinase [Actinocorallia sp. B10E7]|uniref:protein kinase domain-containing protein n=1 Tax=Actinocorallia sp. B10E7 TaxID=3153558 RepID=UPI00325E6F53
MEDLRSGDPRRVGSYELLGRLGAGGMGQVFLGRSPGGRAVAVKVIHPSLTADPRFRARFAREVEAIQLVGGFHTAPVVDADPGADPAWLVTAYVPGPSLREAVPAHGPLPERAVATLGAGLAEGLNAIHACGLVHRDLKPGNVILAADGPLIIDFGIAHLADASSLTATGAFLGTPSYMSPEQARSHDEIGPQSDVFSLGCVLYFAACGRGPFDSYAPALSVHRILNEEPDLSRLPESLRGLVAACLAKRPEDRPTPQDVLGGLASHQPSTADWLPAPLATMVAERSAAVASLRTTPPSATTLEPPSAQTTEPKAPGASERSRLMRLLPAAAVLPLAAVGAAAFWWPTAPTLSGSRPAAQDTAAPSATETVVPSAQPVSDSPSGSAEEKKPSKRTPTASPPSGEHPGPEADPDPPENTSQPKPWRCRGSYEYFPKSNIEAKPCVRLEKDGVGYIVYARAAGEATDGAVSLWTWISDTKITKYRGSLHKCRFSFDSADDKTTCGPFVFTPPKPGTYHTASDSSTADDELPAAWEPPWVGTGSVAEVRWPP